MHTLYCLHKLLYSYIHNKIRFFSLTGLQLDSRNIVLGNLFCAVKGQNTDGRLYIHYAIQHGAVAILADSWNNNTYFYNFKNIPILYVSRLNCFISNIAGYFYHHPSRFLKLVGITGTNGKTTVSHILANWVQLLGENSAVMGTIGYGRLNNLYSSVHTTNSSIDVQKILLHFVNDKVNFVAMEVSSHGLVQYRVDALYFDVAIFTNLSQDHLDYHDNMKTYAESKWRLFSDLNVDKYIINADDPTGYKWLRYLSRSVAVVTFGRLPNHWHGKWIRLVKIKCYFYRGGTDIFFNSSWGRGVIYSPLLGIFNVSNMLLALGTLLELGYPMSLLLHVASQLKPICGRMEIIRSKDFSYPMVIVDYAHTPHALKTVLILMKQNCLGKLWCVFGCGGNRDQKKRTLMGMIACRYADYVIITSDNPRHEDPNSIIQDIICDIKFIDLKKIRIIENRIFAIQFVIQKACVNDLILIAGKGHERHQIIGDKYIYHSDQEIVRDIFKMKIRQ